jgi:MoaA/NifB/PqqE/SkfB family radical SAM enzyme
MRAEQLRSVAEQAAELGISVIVIAGGEPLLRKEEIFSLARSFPHILFPVFTNGLLIDDKTAQEISGIRNIVPVISFEGLKPETDARRGTGVYDHLRASCARLAKLHVFFGCSVTVTSQNHPQVTDRDFIRQMVSAGARVFVFVEYVPVKPGTESLVLSREQQKLLNKAITDFSGEFPALFIGFPGDETLYGGCLAAGRGFIHISPDGNVEPCPAAPFSDANLTNASLRDALQSRFLEQVRRHHDLLTETQGGCALWANRAWVSTLLKRS